MADMTPFSRTRRAGLIEVGCWAHARRYFHKALESDQARMGPALLLIAQLYRVEQQARSLDAGRPTATASTPDHGRFWISCITT